MNHEVGGFSNTILEYGTNHLWGYNRAMICNTLRCDGKMAGEVKL